MSAFSFKIIAMITMFIDHFGAVVYHFQLQGIQILPYEVDGFALRGVGRAAMPIFAFLLVEGFKHTKSVKKYFLRLLAFAIISEIPYNFFANSTNGTMSTFSAEMFFLPEMQNIFFTWAISCLAIWLLDNMKNASWFIKITYILLVLLLIYLCEIIGSDYGQFGVCLVLAIYFTYPKENNRFVQMVVIIGMMSMFYSAFPTYFKVFAGLCGYLLIIYNGKKSNLEVKLNKYLFYAFYPLHLIMLGILSAYLTQTI